jgi:hypothetical protein
VEAIIINIVWIVSGLGIILYPAILLANVMSLRTRSDEESSGTVDYWRRNLTFKAIQLITTLFPVIDYACQRFSRAAFEAGAMTPAVLWMAPPLLTTISIFWIFKRSRAGIAV